METVCFSESLVSTHECTPRRNLEQQHRSVNSPATKPIFITIRPFFWLASNPFIFCVYLNISFSVSASPWQHIISVVEKLRVAEHGYFTG
jgi:hypothetical protein